VKQQPTELGGLAMTVKRIPDGYHSVTPYLVIQGAQGAIDFYKKAFGAEETVRMDHNGKIMHAEMKIGNSMVMLADEFPEMGHKSPQAYGGTPVSMMVYVDDVDKTFGRAIEAGAKEKRPVTNEFWGDRMGTLSDPFGHVWTIASHVEDVAPDEMDRRMREAMKQMGG
jgi:PhnB protein